MIRASRKPTEEAKYSDESSSSSDLDSNLNISDIEDNQGGGGGASAAFEDEFMQEEEEEEEECAGGGDRQLERLANQYMMKSPATMAMRRKSSIEPAGAAASTLLSGSHLSKGGNLGT